jgi:hypothetical protein
MGNKWHGICCGKSGIMYDFELFEGKDAPKERPIQPPEDIMGRTARLLLRLTRHLHTTENNDNNNIVVILDGAFGVLPALLIELRERGSVRECSRQGEEG